MPVTYTPTRLRAPRLAGPLLRVLAELLEHPVTGRPLALKIADDSGLGVLRDPSPYGLPSRQAVFEVAPGPGATGGGLPAPEVVARLERTVKGFAFETVADFAEAYQSGATTPLAVAERLLAAVSADEASALPLRAFIEQRPEDVLAQAEAATARWAAGRPLGPLDGVPVAIKDEVDLMGYRTRVGTKFLGATPATADAAVVARLRGAGAVLIGKANMHEIGLGVTGLNPHHGAARNPYDPTCLPGGSSSGSAVAVAAGYCPVALGADGGGSIRLPAGLCGLVGLKPTFGRLPVTGAAPLCWSVDALGPIAASARDVALAYQGMAGPSEADADSWAQPAPHLDGLEETHLRGVRLGIFRPWFEDADPAVVAACRQLLDGLVAAGAELVEIELEGLERVGAAHAVTIASEMLGSQMAYYERHKRDYGLDVRVNLALARHFSGGEYVAAQRHRAGLFATSMRALARVDVIVTPTAACVAPKLAPDALPDGESNLEVLDAIMRFARLANLTGLPAISVPAGYEGGLPIGLQAMGRPWEEALLLRLARVAEGLVERKAPRVHHRLLG